MKKKIKQLLNTPTNAWEKFIYLTENKASHPFVMNPKGSINKKTQYKGYGRLPELPLPKPHLSEEISLVSSFEKRSSSRSFEHSSICNNELSTLLKYGFGLNTHKESGRFYPSAGAKYPLEAYIVALNTEVPHGVYHYYVKNHSLESLLLTDSIQLSEIFNIKEFSWLKDISLIIIITALIHRTTQTYGNRGLNYILIEAGHAAQNICLVAGSLSRNICPIGGFYEDGIHKLLDIDGETERAVYALVL